VWIWDFDRPMSYGDLVALARRSGGRPASRATVRYSITILDSPILELVEDAPPAATSRQRTAPGLSSPAPNV